VELHNNSNAVIYHPRFLALIHSFHWHVQNSTIPRRSQELLPFLSVMYFLALSQTELSKNFVINICVRYILDVRRYFAIGSFTLNYWRLLQYYYK
jgi:hypothetical protein